MRDAHERQSRTLLFSRSRRLHPQSDATNSSLVSVRASGLCLIRGCGNALCWSVGQRRPIATVDGCGEAEHLPANDRHVSIFYFNYVMDTHPTHVYIDTYNVGLSSCWRIVVLYKDFDKVRVSFDLPSLIYATTCYDRFVSSTNHSNSRYIPDV